MEQDIHTGDESDDENLSICWTVHIQHDQYSCNSTKQDTCITAHGVESGIDKNSPISQLSCKRTVPTEFQKRSMKHWKLFHEYNIDRKVSYCLNVVNIYTY